MTRELAIRELTGGMGDHCPPCCHFVHGLQPGGAGQDVFSRLRQKARMES